MASKGVAKVPYVDTLDALSKKRYFDKIRFVDNVDPYSLPNSAWTKKVACFPAVSYPDIVNYLIFNKSQYSMEDMKAWKSLEAYNQLTSGWISDVAVFVKNDYHIVRGKVLHSQKLREKPLQPWIIADKAGTVCTAHCDCMAGLGEACTHIATLLFAVDTTVKIRDSKTVTQEPAYWLLPAPRKETKYREVGEVNFTSASTQKKQLDEAIASGSPVSVRVRQPKNMEKPSPAELDKLFCGLSLDDTKSVVLSLVAPYSDGFIPKQAQLAFPELLSDMFQEDLYKEPFHVIMDHCSSVTLAVTPQEVEAVEMVTRAQANSRLWPKYRAGRVTASRWHTVCHTDPSQPAASTIKDICYPGRHLTTPAMRWGVRHENTAKAAYCSTMTQHSNFSMRDSGLVIHIQYPEIGASPDGIVTCDCCGEGSLEVKCPYGVRNEVLTEVIEGNTCLTNSADAQLHLKKGHPYYYQVQCQLFVCGHNYGDFVVWTQKSLHCERIYKDDAFMEEMVPKARHFFRVGVLPELLAKCYTRPPLVGCAVEVATANNEDAAEAVWCYCRKEEFGEMVACDGKGCQYEWFHYICVGILSEPKGKWFCPECRKDKRKARMQKR